MDKFDICARLIEFMDKELTTLRLEVSGLRRMCDTSQKAFLLQDELLQRYKDQFGDIDDPDNQLRITQSWDNNSGLPPTEGEIYNLQPKNDGSGFPAMVEQNLANHMLDEYDITPYQFTAKLGEHFTKNGWYVFEDRTIYAKMNNKTKRILVKEYSHGVAMTPNEIVYVMPNK